MKNAVFQRYEQIKHRIGWDRSRECDINQRMKHRAGENTDLRQEINQGKIKIRAKNQEHAHKYVFEILGRYTLEYDGFAYEKNLIV